MNLNDITTKPYILALIIRDDGERLLLGDGSYDFKDNLQHFQADTFVNDVVELQGADGQLLAGQVRRSTTQKFNGYIGDSSMSKQKIEALRRDFLMFFRKKHFYKVVYIFCDGSAIQRKRGYIVNAPTAPEMWQKFPEYSIGLNFEDTNYYEYEEDEFGDEIYAHIVQLALAKALEGGLVWDAIGAVTNGITWSNILSASGEYISIDNTLDRMAPLASVEIDGEATQTTYSGKNLCARGYYESNATARFNLNKTNLQRTFTVSYISDVTAGNATLYLFTDGTNRGSLNVTIQQTAGTRRSATVTLGDTNWGYVQSATEVRITAYLGNAGHTADTTITEAMVENGSSMTAYEPYVGGTASPNPEYPQGINVVTGENVVKITGKNLFSGQWAQFDNHGGTGTIYAYFEIPTDEACTLSITAKSTITSQSASRYIGVSDTGGGASGGHVNWVYAGTEGSTLGQVRSKTTMQSGWTAKYISLYPANEATFNWFIENFDIQLEAGSTRTDYEPYQAQEFPIDLGSIELAKIGTYQDRIYKDSGKWYIEKQIGKADLSTLTWTGGASNQGYIWSTTSITDVKFVTVNTQLGAILATDYTPHTASGMYNTHGYIAVDVSNVKATNNTGNSPTGQAYYALATPTTTEITNEALIDQLDALGAASLYVGMNNIGTTTLNAVPTLKIEYYSAYDEDGAGYEWEAGGGGQNIITVEGIDDAQPVWTVTGPALNPTLTNITTRQTISWQGFVPIGQTLTIDMADMTADLAGANVFEFITGEWIQLRPGNNTLVYTADGGAEADSTLSWNGVAS